MRTAHDTHEPSRVVSRDARSGRPRDWETSASTPGEVDAAVRAAADAAPPLRDREVRIALLRAAAREIAADGERIIAAADAETGLGVPRLEGELARVVAQFRLFADEVADGGHLGVTIDHADTGVVPARPDLRRYQVPLGVVAVFAASNFPLAFSVPGGDTASAWAAGCPVVVKAHPGHPHTSELCAAALRRAAGRAGLEPGVLGVVHGFDAGLLLVRHERVAGVGFTGSVAGGRALFDEVAARAVPIPFHGELGSVNPVVVTEEAAAIRAAEIAEGLAGSVALGLGQFCVKPGVVLVPRGEDGDELVRLLAGRLAEVPGGALLTERIRESFVTGVGERTATPGVTRLVEPSVDGTAVSAGLLTVDADGFTPLLGEECFGPLAVVVRYGSRAEAEGVLAGLAGSLTGTVQLGPGELAAGSPWVEVLARSSGRVVVNAWPTGVAVTWAQHHGGPYPAATSPATSVGAAAVTRWLRPVVFQNAPASVLPPELREDNPLGLPRRVDGAWRY
ncbi:aldehyde dehydrogenase family protein [Streptomyces sp. GSL17-111]|uniref:aldehyde dehydrogenase family protein n=1 Tax=Streptomyces sp. GSL17-111 TaxID=3121596 RepID=UPI0030F41C0F